MNNGIESYNPIGRVNYVNLIQINYPSAFVQLWFSPSEAKLATRLQVLTLFTLNK